MPRLPRQIRVGPRINAARTREVSLVIGTYVEGVPKPRGWRAQQPRMPYAWSARKSAAAKVMREGPI